MVLSGNWKVISFSLKVSLTKTIQISSEILLVSRLKYPYSCLFSFHFNFFAIVVLLTMLSRDFGVEEYK